MPAIPGGWSSVGPGQIMKSCIHLSVLRASAAQTRCKEPSLLRRNQVTVSSSSTCARRSERTRSVPPRCRLASAAEAGLQTVPQTARDTSGTTLLPSETTRHFVVVFSAPGVAARLVTWPKLDPISCRVIAMASRRDRHRKTAPSAATCLRCTTEPPASSLRSVLFCSVRRHRAPTRAVAEPEGDPTVVTKGHSSAQLRTLGRGDFQYGRSETRIQLHGRRRARGSELPPRGVKSLAHGGADAAPQACRD